MLLLVTSLLLCELPHPAFLLIPEKSGKYGNLAEPSPRPLFRCPASGDPSGYLGPSAFHL
uniref:Colony stimulating factor 2 receptor subunit alpha n=1 Tax=Homo sapiens TaxID=9606 RepID=A0A8Q3SIC6_HUMAN